MIPKIKVAYVDKSYNKMHHISTNLAYWGSTRVSIKAKFIFLNFRSCFSANFCKLRNPIPK